MSSARVKTVQVGMVDVSKVGTKRKLGIELEEVETFITSVIVHPRPTGDAQTAEAPFLGDEGEYIWPRHALTPPFIDQVYRLCRDLFELKTEIEDFSIRIFPPALAINPHHQTTIARVGYEAALAVACRIVIVVGSNEIIELHAKAGGREGTGAEQLHDGYGLMLPIGMPAGIDIIFDDAASKVEPARKGFRPRTVRKRPMKRWVIVVDGYANADVLASAMKGSEVKASENVAAVASAFAKKA